jgi:hypothetical protein
MKKTPYMDPQTGEYNLKFNMQNILEDFYIPVRGGDATTRIETTKGLDYTAIEDVQYLRDKLFAALKVPKAYLTFETESDLRDTENVPLKEDIHTYFLREVKPHLS